MNDIHALSGAYALDALDDVERTAFEAHLNNCETCLVEVAELIETASRMSVLSQAAPSPSVREGLLAQISTVRPLAPLPSNAEPDVVRAEREQSPQPEPGPQPQLPPAAVITPMQRHSHRAQPLRRRSMQRIASWGAAAAAVAAIGVGLAVTTPWHDETGTPNASTQVLTADDAERVSLSFPDGARATVVRSVEAGRAVLITQDMPAPPDGKVYQVWLEDETGSMVPAGVMPIKEDQTVVLDGDAAAATAAGITVEPTGGSPAPTSDPIALFAFEGGA